MRKFPDVPIYTHHTSCVSKPVEPKNITKILRRRKSVLKGVGTFEPMCQTSPSPVFFCDDTPYCWMFKIM